MDPESTLPERYVVPSRVDRAGGGGPTPDQTRGPHWRRTSRGYYVPATTPTDDVGQRIVEASVAVRRRGAITGWAGLRWLGGSWFDGTLTDGRPRPVDLVSGTHDIRRQQGIAPSGEGLDPERVIVHHGLRVTDAAYSLAFAMRHAPSDREAVTLLDLAAYSDLVSVAEASACLAGQGGWTGVPRARRALALAEENCWSPAESRMRLTWHLDGGFAMPRGNRPVFDRQGALLGTPDLLDVEAGVAGEYDGSVHLTRARRDSDLVREERLRSHGLELVLMTAADRADPGALLGRLERAYARSRATAGRPRSWTDRPPPWWVPTHTVALRRALSADERRRFLRYRRAA